MSFFTTLNSNLPLVVGGAEFSDSDLRTSGYTSRSADSPLFVMTSGLPRSATEQYVAESSFLSMMSSHSVCAAEQFVAESPPLAMASCNSGCSVECYETEMPSFVVTSDRTDFPVDRIEAGSPQSSAPQHEYDSLASGTALPESELHVSTLPSYDSPSHVSTLPSYETALQHRCGGETGYIKCEQTVDESSSS